MSKPIRILIADDDHLVRTAIRSLLEQQPDFQIVGEAADGVQAVAQAAALAPDVILLDLIMPQRSGSETITALREADPHLHILIFSGFADDDLVIEATRAGASGYLLKTASLDELSRAIRSVYRGEMPLHPSIAHRIIRELTHPQSPPPRPEPLTQREVGILQLLARGLSNYDIAQTLRVTEPTVRTHVTRILKKLHITSRTQAALYALKNGLANLEEDQS